MIKRCYSLARQSHINNRVGVKTQRNVLEPHVNLATITTSEGIPYQPLITKQGTHPLLGHPNKPPMDKYTEQQFNNERAEMAMRNAELKREIEEIPTESSEEEEKEKSLLKETINEIKQEIIQEKNPIKKKELKIELDYLKNKEKEKEETIIKIDNNIKKIKEFIQTFNEEKPEPEKIQILPKIESEQEKIQILPKIEPEPEKIQILPKMGQLELLAREQAENKLNNNRGLIIKNVKKLTKYKNYEKYKKMELNKHNVFIVSKALNLPGKSGNQTLNNYVNAINSMRIQKAEELQNELMSNFLKNEENEYYEDILNNLRKQYEGSGYKKKIKKQYIDISRPENKIANDINDYLNNHNLIMRYSGGIEIEEKDIKLSHPEHLTFSSYELLKDKALKEKGSFTSQGKHIIPKLPPNRLNFELGTENIFETNVKISNLNNLNETNISLSDANNIISKLVGLLASDINKLYSINSELKTIILLMETGFRPSDKDIDPCGPYPVRSGCVFPEWP